MRLKSFRVKMYKSVIDSEEIRVSPLSVIVGKNESGKTTLLKALHKLNPAVPESYNIRDEWPRGFRDKRDESHMPCVATFELEAGEAQQIAALTNSTRLPVEISIGRTYAGALQIVSADVAGPDELAVISSWLPKFVFMDEYQVFNGMAYLDQVQARRANPTPEDKSLMTILSLAGLDIDELVRQGQEPDKTERQHNLSDGGATITRRLASHWKQQPYVVELEADQQQFWTFLKAPNETARVKLEERSRGFRWFFSFDAKLAHETQGELKNCVILLDEPGLHLHASAQKDLLVRLEEYAATNTLIYTTHLPFMINLREPDRIRVMSGERAEGAKVSEKLTEATPEAKMTLQAALGMNGLVGMPADEKNLTVEGVHDYWYLTALSGLFERSGKPGVPQDLLISACGGAHEVTYLSTFMVGQRLRVIALYDSDGEGQAARDKFVKGWLARYGEGKSSAVMIGEAIGATGDAAVEDLFPEAFFLEAVKEVYKDRLSAPALASLELSPGGTLGNRAEAAVAAHNLGFSKGAVARHICAKIRHMKDAKELPAQTQERASKLFEAIAKAAK